VPIGPSPLNERSSTENTRDAFSLVLAVLLLALMALLSGGAALRESVTIDEVAHIGAGVSYLQKLDLRLNEEHPPLPKVLAALPLVLRGVHADYSHVSWTVSKRFISGFLGEWVFGEYLLTKWNDPATVLAWTRMPMLLLTLVLGWLMFSYARRLGDNWGGLLGLSIFVSTPAFLAFGPLVHTDMPVTLFTLLTLWRFAEIWQNPTRKNGILFGLSLAGALLCKFTSGLLFFVFLAFVLSTRWLPVPGQPIDKPEARAWRRLRWRHTLVGILWASLAVYVFYFVFSIRQTTDVLYLLGHGPAAVPLRRLLMPPWLYFRGVAMVLITGSRQTFILGHTYPHGVWFYFPILFLLKSPLAFLGLLLWALVIALAIKLKRREQVNSSSIPQEFAIHWRVLRVALIVFTGFCMLSRLDISIRHFSIPLVLLILLLAPLPRMVTSLWPTDSSAGRLAGATAGWLALICLLTAVRAYPFYFPFINSLSFGHPTYALVNDSNLDWNQSLPEVKLFAASHGLQRIPVDQYGLNDPTVFVPGAELWNCQLPTAADEGQWVVVSANMIVDDHNCVWLMQYPHESLAGGSMYAVHLPDHIPSAGSPGGAPLASAQRQFVGAPIDMRFYFLDLIHHPDELPRAIAEMEEQYRAANEAKSISQSRPLAK